MVRLNLGRTTLRIGLIIGLAFIIFAAGLFWRRHAGIVLLHAFADTNCACGDFQEEVSGINVLNPLRDRQPEKEAEKFFQQATQGQCSIHYDADLCQYFERVAPAKAWKLVNAEAKGNGIDLFYKLDSSRDLPNMAWTGEGYVHVSRVADGWRVSSYSVYF